MEELRERRRHRLTGAVVRRELRKWVRDSTEGKAVESSVGRLLASG